MINERQIALRKGGNYTALDDFFDRRKVIPLPFNETAVVNVAGAQFKLIDNSMLVASNMAIGLATVESGGLFATLLPGAVGIASLLITSDSLGNILNAVRIRDEVTHDPIVESGGKEVFALVQAVSTASDGDAIGAPASENMQLSFVYVAADGTLTLTSVTADVEFLQNNVYLERNIPTIMMEGGNPDADALAPYAVVGTQGEYEVTTPFIANEVITLATGAGSGSGVASKTGDTIDIGASDAAFKNNHLLEVYLNGVNQRKETDVKWVSSGSLKFVSPLDDGDYFEIRLLS